MASRSWTARAVAAWQALTAGYLRTLAYSPLALPAAALWVDSLLTVRRLADGGAQGSLALAGWAIRRDQQRGLDLLHQVVARLDRLEQGLAAQRSADQ